MLAGSSQQDLLMNQSKGIKPHLSPRLIKLLLFVIATHGLIILLAQSDSYWSDYAQGSTSFTPLNPLLQINPWLFGATILVYLLLLGILLSFLKRPLTFPIWLTLLFVHIRDINTNASCLINRYFEIELGLCNFIPPILTLLFAIITAVILISSIQSPPQEPSTLTKIVVRSMTAVWFIAIGFGLFQVANASKFGWRLIETTGSQPSGRSSAAIAYDSQQNEAVLFGGVTGWDGVSWQFSDETWSWNGADWTQHFPTNKPSPRSEHQMAYDPKSGAILLFGGHFQNNFYQDTWLWNGEDWEQQHPQTVPPSRCCAALFYDVQREQIVLYAGHDLSQFYGDAWAWDGENWNLISFDSPLPTTSVTAISFNETNGQVNLFNLEGTWQLINSTWYPVSTPSPPYREFTRLVYDKNHRVSLLFGGIENGQVTLADTWLLNSNNEWHQVSSPISPTPRTGHTLFYDESRQRVMLFGGNESTHFSNELWEFTPSERDVR